MNYKELKVKIWFKLTMFRIKLIHFIKYRHVKAKPLHTGMVMYGNAILRTGELTFT